MTRSDDTEVPDYLAMLRLDHRAVVVVGAGQGIGRQAAHALSQAGAKVLAVDVDRDLADDVAAEVGGVACYADARERDDVERMIVECDAAFHRLDAIVDIVGAARFGDFLDSTDDDWQWQFDIVLRHAMLVGQIGGRGLAAHGGGALVFVASISALTSSPKHAVYGVAKAGLLSLVRTLAVELGPTNVKVNAVAPGGTWTPRMAVVLGQAGHDATAAVVPRRRMAIPTDIAAGLLFMVSDLSDFVHGQVLVVDGGGHQNFPYTLDFIS